MTSALEATPSATSRAANPLLDAPILPTLLRLAWPNLVAMLATALAAIAETGYVGRFGVPSLAGMALVFPIVMLQAMLSAGAMGGGVSSAVSRALGAGQAARADALAVHAMWIGVIAGSLIMLTMHFFGPALFGLLGGSGEALAQAVAFAQVAFLGSIAVWLANTFASVLRGSGNMAVPSATFFAVAATQVLVGGALGLGWGPLPRLGMPGVAAGQVLAYTGGALFLFGYLRSGRSRVRLPLGSTPLSGEILRFRDVGFEEVVADGFPQTVIERAVIAEIREDNFREEKKRDHLHQHEHDRLQGDVWRFAAANSRNAEGHDRGAVHQRVIERTRLERDREGAEQGRTIGDLRLPPAA